MGINSSGSVERFTLASGENKTFRNQRAPYGPDLGNVVEIEVHGEENQDNLGNPIDPGSNSVVLQTSEDNVSFSTVATLAVVSRGQKASSGAVGAYWRALNNGPALAHVVIKPLNVCQVVPAL